MYKDDDIRKDGGYTIFYMGINIGAATVSIIVGYVGEEIGWHYGFGLAGIFMFIGQCYSWILLKNIYWTLAMW